MEPSAAGGAAPRKATEVVSPELAAARSQELAAASQVSPDPASLTLRAAAPSQAPEPDEKKKVGAGVFIGVGLLGLLLCGLGLAALSFVLFSGVDAEAEQEAWRPPVSTERSAAVHEPAPRGKAPVTPDPRPAAAPPPPPPPPRVEPPGPTSALDGYYGAINRRDRSGAWRHFAKPGWDYAKWERSLWRTSGCARVNSSRVTSQAGSTAQLWADLCVEDTAAGQVHRWQGPMEVVRTPQGRWAVAGWSVNRAGTCSSSCRP